MCYISWYFGLNYFVQIPWKNDDKLLAAWRDARTGFPWIDAIMMQVRFEIWPIFSSLSTCLLVLSWIALGNLYIYVYFLIQQLRKWGWMHHLARHCVACFLTRGDLVSNLRSIGNIQINIQCLVDSVVAVFTVCALGKRT